MTRIKFKKPRLYYPDPMKLECSFPFDIIMDNHEYDIKDKEITVSITAILLLGIWAYKEYSEQEKVLFQFVLDKIKTLSREELIVEEIKISLAEGNQNREKPFDPNKIPYPDGFTIQIDDSISKPKNKIGFWCYDNS